MHSRLWAWVWRSSCISLAPTCPRTRSTGLSKYLSFICREMAKLLTDGWAIRDVKTSVSPTFLLSEATLPEKRNTQSTLLQLPISSSTPMILSATSVRRTATTFVSALLATLIRTPTQNQRRRISSGLRQSATPAPTLLSRNCFTMSTYFRSGSRLAVPRVNHRSLYHVIAC